MTKARWLTIPPSQLTLLRGQFCKTEISLYPLLHLPRPTVLQSSEDFKSEGEGHRRGKRLCFLLSGVVDRESKKMRQIFGREGTLGSFDLQRSKSCPLTFRLGAASCLALIKPCKHPNHRAGSTHFSPPSFLPQFCRLCNSVYYSFKALS